MIHHELLEQGVLIVTPEGPLDSADFEALAETVDPYLERKGNLKGLMIYVASFPGWNDFAALISHFKFVKGHHQKIAKVAAVTDGGILSILPRLANHFVDAEVKHFDYRDKERALQWLSGQTL